MSSKKLLNNLGQALKNAETEVEQEFLLREYQWFLEKPERAETYQHRPIPIKEWIEKPYAGAFGKNIRPTVKEILIDVFTDPEAYDEIVIVGGIGIGKSFLSGAGAAYLAHRLMCLRDPKDYFGLLGGAPIAIMNMSVNGMQARKIVFSQINEAISSPWFQYMDYLPDDKSKSELRMKKHLQVLPGNSQDTFFIGFDLYAGILDEGAWHEVTPEKDYAEEGYSAMQRRVKSRFPGTGKLFIVTSPRYVDDFAERKLKEAEMNPRIYARRIRAWQSMPQNLDNGKYFYFDPVRNIIYDEHQLTDDMKKVIEDKVVVTEEDLQKPDVVNTKKILDSLDVS